MGRRSVSSGSSISNSSCNTIFSHNSRHTHNTDITSCTNSRPRMKRCDTASADAKHATYAPVTIDGDEGLPRTSTSSVDTYASTNDSRDNLTDVLHDQFPRERDQCLSPDAFPTTAPQFAELFPSTRRLLIQHDDSTPDGNMNLRVDTDVTTKSGKRKKMTLFHLRMNDLAERQFSIRRYCRESGREVASSKRRYMKPLPPDLKYQKPAFRRSFTHALQNLGRPIPQRQDSGYESEDDEDDELEASLRAWTLNPDVKATVPTSAIRLEFSNYAQVIVDPHRTNDGKEYAFEYWGEYYCWRRRFLKDGSEIICSYELLNAVTSKRIATVVPDALSTEEVEFEAAQGAWIPASTMRLLDNRVSDDLGDVIVATGLIALTDDCLSRHARSERRPF